MATVKDISVAQLQAVLIQCTAVLRQQCNDDDEGIDASSYTQVSTAAVAAIERVSGAGSVYSERARYHINHTMYYTSTVNHLMGLVRALLNDVEAGFVHAIKEIAHAELFSDFMLMADFLLKEGYKDAAAVMIGGVLEAHLRQLCIKYGVDLEHAGKPKRAEQLNADLARLTVYNLLDQKSVTAWLDLRNKAAHAKYGDYTKEQVLLMLQSIQNFIARFPA